MRKIRIPKKVQHLRQTQIDFGSETLPILVRRDARARRITLRFNPWSRDITVTLPRTAPVSEGLDFAELKRPWLENVIAKSPKKVSFEPGAIIPILGRPYRIEHRPRQKGVVVIEGDAVYVSGAPEFLSRRLRDWLKMRVKEIITEWAQTKAEMLDRPIRAISVRDTRSRWGSCSADGRLFFSWRLIFATPDVLDYVVSHEVAHLAELNHSKRFWNMVEQLCPGWETSNEWLKHHGQTLYVYGK